MQRPNLNKLLSKWVKRLRLQDWNFEIKYATRVEMDDDTAVGKSRISPNNFYVKILILDPKESESWIPTLRNIELTIVHELVHVAIVWLKEQEEVVVERIAQALMEV